MTRSAPSLASVVRNGVTEAEHHLSVAAVDPQRRLVAAAGDIDRIFYARSSAKPFQATVATEAGVDLRAEELAVACASHGGYPVHLAYVRRILASAGLDETALQTPEAWPMAPRARDVAVRQGAQGPRPIFHNCSGKHAAMLAACRAAGWSVADYLDPQHPLQLRITAMMEEVTGRSVERIGVDGCGAPVFEVSTRDLAEAFAALAAAPRFARVRAAMHRHPSLVSENGRIDSRVATAIDGVAKVGAEGCIGVGVRGRWGLAAKCWDGSGRGVEAGIIGGLRVLGGAVTSAAAHMTPGPPVLGGGRVQGSVTVPEVTRVG